MVKRRDNVFTVQRTEAKRVCLYCSKNKHKRDQKWIAGFLCDHKVLNRHTQNIQRRQLPIVVQNVQ